jgi:hypothetical protein
MYLGSSRARPLGRRNMLSIVATLLLSASLIAQATFSAAPPLLYQVETIYIAPSSEDLAPLLKVRLENWTAVRVTSSPNEADAILSCETQNTIVPAKAVLRLTVADITLVDRHSRKLVWKTNKSTTLGTARLADDVVEQLKKDWRKSASRR